jgi:hypothetical protein
MLSCQLRSDRQNNFLGIGMTARFVLAEDQLAIGMHVEDATPTRHQNDPFDRVRRPDVGLKARHNLLHQPGSAGRVVSVDAEGDFDDHHFTDYKNRPRRCPPQDIPRLLQVEAEAILAFTTTPCG